jgi:hypothetical protein
MTRVPGTGSRRSPPYSPGSSPRRSKGAWRWPRAGARVRLPGREPEADAVTSRGRRQAHVEGFDLTPVCGYRPMIAPAGSLWAAMYSAPRRPQDTRHQGWGGPLTIGPKLLLPPRRDIAAASRDCHRINRWASPEGRHWPAGRRLTKTAGVGLLTPRGVGCRVLARLKRSHPLGRHVGGRLKPHAQQPEVYAFRPDAAMNDSRGPAPLSVKRNHV